MLDRGWPATVSAATGLARASRTPAFATQPRIARSNKDFARSNKESARRRYVGRQPDVAVVITSRPDSLGPADLPLSLKTPPNLLALVAATIFLVTVIFARNGPQLLDGQGPLIEERATQSLDQSLVGTSR
jgi:hypothetical protein